MSEWESTGRAEERMNASFDSALRNVIL